MLSNIRFAFGFGAMILLGTPLSANPLDILDGMVPIMDQDFTQGLSRFDGTTGVWSTQSTRGQLLTNAAETVFIDPTMPGVAWSTAPQTVVTTADGLSLRTVQLPDAARTAVQTQLNANRRSVIAPEIEYGAGRITTADTWAQTYGWFEVEAQLPVGRGRWPAFWLTFAGVGWPPEITIFEGYGRGIARATPKDDRFNMAVHFDVLDETLEPVFDVDIINPFAADPSQQEPEIRDRHFGKVYKFSQVNYGDQLGLDIYGQVNTYAALWTPEVIVFYAGPNRDSLSEVFRTPTPEDVNAPLYVIANDQFTMRGGHWPADRALDAVLDPENDFLVKSIRVWAPEPENRIQIGDGQDILGAGSSVINDTSGDDIFATGDGFDLIHLSGGMDEIHVARGREGKVIHGFGPDDRLVLDGFTFANSQDAFDRLTQVDNDVWLSSGADPFWPQSIIFRDTAVENFSPEQIVSRWPVETNTWLTRADISTIPFRDNDNDGVIQPARQNVLLSDQGNPILMYGGLGSDRYLISNRLSQVIEPANGSIDAAVIWGARLLPENVERGILRGENGRLSGTDGPDRLEAEGVSGSLNGGLGDDLYIISPEAENTVIWIIESAGHDVLRGLSADDRLVMSGALRTKQETWRWVQDNRGVLVHFNDDQSLLIEGTRLAEGGNGFEFR